MKCGWKLLTIIKILPILLFFSCGAKKSSSFYGIDTSTSNKIVYLLDVSASMEGKAEKNFKEDLKSFAKEVLTEGTVREIHKQTKDAPGGEIIGAIGSIFIYNNSRNLNKLSRAKQQLKKSIKGLNENTNFTIIFFGSKIKKWEENLIPASDFNKKRAISYLRHIESKGGTNIYEALESAFDVLSTSNTSSPETIFLLTDGRPSKGKTIKKDSIIQQTIEWNRTRNAKINTIGLGKDCKTGFLLELANRNHGIFVHK